MSSLPWTPEEWDRRMASLAEDVRVLEAMIADDSANAQMLRERGHGSPAEVMEHAIHQAQEIADEIKDRLERSKHRE